jgi:hypothetical protein
MAAITASLTVLVCVVAGFFEAGDGADFSFVAPRTVAGLAWAKMKYPAVKATAAIATSRPHCDTKKTSPSPTQRHIACQRELQGPIRKSLWTSDL